MDAAACALLLSAQAPLWARAQSLAPGWLTVSEQERMSSMRAARQREFVACRYGMRLLLAGGHDGAAGWRLASLRETAPSVQERGAGGVFMQSIQLTLSHSAGWLACAAAPGPVGVDLERLAKPPRRDVHAIGELVCSGPEREWLLQQQEGLGRQHGLVQLWSLKEAYFKSRGCGVDFSRVRQLAWRPGVSPAGAGMEPVARARQWLGLADDGHFLCLSLCMPGHVPDVLWSEPAAVDWRAVMEWQLFALM